MFIEIIHRAEGMDGETVDNIIVCDTLAHLSKCGLGIREEAAAIRKAIKAGGEYVMAAGDAAGFTVRKAAWQGRA
jgi:hypothetical protein